MRIVVVGASGTIGSTVADALADKGHEVVRASRSGEVKVDIEKPESIRAMFDKLGKIDGVISCAGSGAWKKLTELEDSDLHFSVANKQLGNVNLVRHGIANMNDGGFFILTAGIFSKNPPPGVPALAMVNGALESFARAAALDLPRGIRINTISPPFIQETAVKLGVEGGLPAVDNAKSYVEYAENKITGQVIFSGE